MPGDMTVHAGATDQADNSLGQRIEVDSFIWITPLWNPTDWDNDLVLLRLESPLDFNETVQPIPVATNCNFFPWLLKGDSLVTLSGYTSLSNLSQTQVKLISNAAAKSLNDIAFGTPSRNVPASTMRAAYEFGKGADSYTYENTGSPTVVYVEDQPVLYGLYSWAYGGGGCGSVPSQFVNLNYYAEAPAPNHILNASGGSPTNGGVLDIFLKDCVWDVGRKNECDGGDDQSPDVWVRRDDDGGLEHQDPEFSYLGDSNYVYVRVRNRSCQDLNGGEVVKLYWTKSSSWTSWPANWDGSVPGIGGLVGIKPIPVDSLETGGETTLLKFPWLVPDSLAAKRFGTVGWEVCLMARVEGVSGDPIIITPGALHLDVRNNNNVALHNVVVVDEIPLQKTPPGYADPGLPNTFYPHGSTMYVGNPLAQGGPKTFNLHFVANPFDERVITADAEVKVIFDSLGWSIITNSPALNQPGVQVVRPREIILHHSSTVMPNLVFPQGVRVPIYVGFSFKADSIPHSAERYRFKVGQSFAGANDTLIGSVNYRVLGPLAGRGEFEADGGGDRQLAKNESTTLSADYISETAVFNWYDGAGNLVGSGQNVTVTPDVSQRYKLEIIATADGAVDYDSVDVAVQPYDFVSISPNPAFGSVAVSYDAGGATSAYIMLLHPFSSTSSNYILDVTGTSSTLNIASLSPGVYTAVLICNGVAVESKTLQIQ